MEYSLTVRIDKFFPLKCFSNFSLFIFTDYLVVKNKIYKRLTIILFVKWQNKVPVCLISSLALLFNVR